MFEGQVDGVEPVSDDIRALDADTVLDELAHERAVVAAAEARQLALAVHFVDLHPVTADHPAATCEKTAVNGDTPIVFAPTDGAQPLAGEGTPSIARYAVEALGAHLHVPYGTAWALVAEAVEICHRLPRLWRHVHTGRLSAWQARLVARETTPLTREGAAWVDVKASVLVARGRALTLPRVRDLVHEARCRLDPDWEHAVQEAAAQNKRVDFDHPTASAAAVTSMKATLDAWDAHQLDAALDEHADQLLRLGDTSSHDVRRATALGMLAHPQTLLDLTGQETDDDNTDDGAPSPIKTGTTGMAGTTGSKVTLYVHANLTDLISAATAGHGTGTVEDLGPALLATLKTWLHRTDRITLKPVLDPTNPDTTATRPVDQHDPPDPMADLVRLRDGSCIFPGCQTPARRCDLDHTTPYQDPDDGGPPGQTHPDNLARLPLPTTPPVEDLHQLAIPTHARRQLRLDQPHRPHLRQPPPPDPPRTHLTPLRVRVLRHADARP